MKKFKVKFEWYVSMRGYDEVEIEAESEEKARQLYWQKISTDYNDHCKIIDSHREITGVEEIL